MSFESARKRSRTRGPEEINESPTELSTLSRKTEPETSENGAVGRSVAPLSASLSEAVEQGKVLIQLIKSRQDEHEKERARWRAEKEQVEQEWRTRRAECRAEKEELWRQKDEVWTQKQKLWTQKRELWTKEDEIKQKLKDEKKNLEQKLKEQKEKLEKEWILEKDEIKQKLEDEKKKSEQEWRNRRYYSEIIWPELNELMQRINLRPLPTGLVSMSAWKREHMLTPVVVTTDRLRLIRYYLDIYNPKEMDFVFLLLSFTVFSFESPIQEMSGHPLDTRSQASKFPQFSIDPKKVDSSEFSEPRTVLEKMSEPHMLERLEETVSALLAPDDPLGEEFSSKIGEKNLRIFLKAIGKANGGYLSGSFQNTSRYFEDAGGLFFARFTIEGRKHEPCMIYAFEKIPFLDMKTMRDQEFNSGVFNSRIEAAVKRLTLEMLFKKCAFGCVLDLFSGILCEIDFERFESIKAQHEHEPTLPKKLPIKYMVFHSLSTDKSFCSIHVSWIVRSTEHSQQNKERIERLEMAQFYRESWPVETEVCSDPSNAGGRRQGSSQQPGDSQQPVKCQQPGESRTIKLNPCDATFITAGDYLTQVFKIRAKDLIPFITEDIGPEELIVAKVFDYMNPATKWWKTDQLDGIKKDVIRSFGAEWNCIQALTKDPEYNSCYLKHAQFEIELEHFRYGVFWGRCILSRFIDSSFSLDLETYEKAQQQLDVIHKHGIIHGDIAHRNILCQGDKLYIIDFGNSFFSDSPEDQLEDNNKLKSVFRQT